MSAMQSVPTGEHVRAELRRLRAKQRSDAIARRGMSEALRRLRSATISLREENSLLRSELARLHRTQRHHRAQS